MAILYQHRRLDNNEIFYIGIGKSIKRATSKHCRNNYWKNIVNKYGFISEILYYNLTWEQACNLEKELIKWYGRKDLGLGNLVNMTDGGEGVIGRIVSKSSNIKRSISMKGKVLTEDHKEKLKKSKIGTKQSSSHSKNRGIFKKKEIINIITNEKYNSLDELISILNINKETMRKKLNGILNNNTNFKYTERWL